MAQRNTCVVHENEIGTTVIKSAIAIHRELGPGLFETVYEVVLAHELKARGLEVQRQVPIPIKYKSITFDEGFRADVLINRQVLLELKSVQAISPAHKKQMQTYLKLTGCRLGYLLNFGAALMKHGIVRAVNGLSDQEKTKTPRLRVSARVSEIRDRLPLILPQS